MQRQFGGVLLGSMELFCLAAELGSFTAAAQAAGVTPAAVSRSVARLEERLGVRLFTRTTRRVSLTGAGDDYFQQCRQALAQLGEAERLVSGRQSEPAGLLRISLPTTYGHYRVLPLLPAFRARYPLVRVEVELSNRNVDFTSEAFDLAIRARAQADSSLIARPLEDAPLVVVATPDYLRQAGTPRSPAELDGHQCIQFRLPSSGRPVPWLFREQGREVELTTQGDYCCAQDILACATLARSGAGLAQLMRFIVEEDLSAGRLLQVLQDHGGCSRPFSLIYPSGRHLPLRVRVFIDFLLQAVGR
ncbi:LysR family transcriptional regulator [Pseudomonas lalucatii]|uniref:LysR family transcriptional regulator n=1 Tax=Pseudomonas lalucatii TaxID=1424203 RepID=A0ABS5Q7K1_9PSED|nr:LysR family transcriptional regulator [Pseudomonas lalucatii]MBS7664233.1 LysR family transcriptional regulator [Pseudomonas lalucatii]